MLLDVMHLSEYLEDPRSYKSEYLLEEQEDSPGQEIPFHH